MKVCLKESGVRCAARHGVSEAAISVGEVDSFGRSRTRNPEPQTPLPMINWAISLFLLSFVSLFFSVLGTDGPFASLVGRILAASFLILAVAMFGIHLKHRHRHPGSN